MSTEADGAPIKEFRTHWHRACQAAGLPGRLLHDFRRTAVRNMERAGIQRSVAMSMVGHKTEAIYRRYAIVDAALLRDATARIDRAVALGWNSSRSSVGIATGVLHDRRWLVHLKSACEGTIGLLRAFSVNAILVTR